MTGTMLIDVLVAFFNAVTSIMTAEYLYSIFSKKNEKNKWLIPVCFVAFFLSPLVFGKTIVNTVILIMLPFFVAFKYDFKIYNKVLFAIIFVATSSVAEIIVQLLLSFTFNTDTQSVIYESKVYFVTGIVLSKLFAFVIFFVIGAFKNKVLVGKFSVKWLALYSLPIATLVICYTIFHSTFMLRADNWIVYLTLVGMLLLGLSNFMIFKLVNNIHDSAVNEERLKMAEELVKQQEKQYGLIFESNEQVSKQRHDYKNFLYGLLAETKSGNLESIDKRLECELENIGSKAELASGNSVVDTIIGYKKSEAAAKGIDIEFEYRNVSSVKISGVDLALILGNAIDNAIEGCAELSAGDKKKIGIFIVAKDGTLIITVSNRVAKNRDVTNLASTKKDANLHGFGIMNMKSVAAKYGGEVVFECKDNVFKTVVQVDNV